jgi:hypothetical protein
LTACNKSTDEEDDWAAKYTGNYLFTTISHIEYGGLTVEDTTIYNGDIKVVAKPKIKINYEPIPTSPLSPLYTYVSEDGTLNVENSGSHSDFTGKFDVDGNVEFYIASFGSWWTVQGVKKE